MDSDEGKIFVRGISWNTNENHLSEYFSNFGEVLDVKIIRDKATGRSKGYGFVLFSDPAVIDRVLQDKHHIQNREVVVKRKTPSEEHNLAKRIFVGHMPPSLTLEELRAYFEAYGTVSDVVIMIDQATQDPRGFGFVSFDSEDSVDHVLRKNFHRLNGNLLHVQRALPKDANPGVDSGGGGPGADSSGSGAGAASSGGRVGAFPFYGGSGGSCHPVEIQWSLPQDANPGVASGRRGTGVFLGNGGAGAASASGGGGTGEFPVYGGSSGSGYEGHMDSNRYMRPQNTGSGYPPSGASGYGYRGFGGYGYPTGAPYGDPGVPGASGPTSSWGAQVPLGYGSVEYGNAAPCSAGLGSAVIEQIGGSGGNGNHQADNGQDVMVEVMEKMLWWKFSSGLMVDVMVGYGGVGGYGYPADAPYGNPSVSGASGPSSSWGAQVSSSYGNLEYGNAARGGGFGPGSSVREQVGGSAGYGYGSVGGYGYPAGVSGASGPSSSWGAQVSSSYGNVDYGNAARGGGFGGYGYRAGAPYGNPGVPRASGPSSSWSAQVPSGYDNVGYRNAALRGGSGPGSSVMRPAVGSAGYGYGGNDSSFRPPSAYGAVDGNGSGIGSADASNGAGDYRNGQTNHGRAGYGGSCGKGKQVQQ